MNKIHFPCLIFSLSAFVQSTPIEPPLNNSSTSFEQNEDNFPKQNNALDSGKFKSLQELLDEPLENFTTNQELFSELTREANNVSEYYDYDYDLPPDNSQDIKSIEERVEMSDTLKKAIVDSIKNINEDARQRVEMSDTLKETIVDSIKKSNEDIARQRMEIEAHRERLAARRRIKLVIVGLCFVILTCIWACARLCDWCSRPIKIVDVSLDEKEPEVLVEISEKQAENDFKTNPPPPSYENGAGAPSLPDDDELFSKGQIRVKLNEEKNVCRDIATQTEEAS